MLRLIRRGGALVGEWPELSELVGRPMRSDGDSAKSWDYVHLACEAVGGDANQAIPGMAAIFYLQVAIGLVDDILDDDPKGLHLKLGAGRAANLAAACQALSAEMLSSEMLSSEMLSSEIPESRRYLLHEILARAALATARGQELDVLLPSATSSGKPSEEAYWQLTDAKTPPLFVAALALGAVSGGADGELVARIGELGHPLGRMIQIGDDLTDALEGAQRPDWQRPGANLAMVFALLAEHDGQHRFGELVAKLHYRHDKDDLAEAQELLVASGAVGYCCHRLLAAYKDVETQLDELGLPHPDFLGDAFSDLITPLRSLLEQLGYRTSDLLHLESA